MSENAMNAAVFLDKVGIVRPGPDGGEKTVIDRVSFVANSAEITGIVGPSGGGKSSLIRLINRLNDPTSGTVYLDGRDIRTLDPLQLRRRVAMVMQKPYMFEGTVLSNLQRPFLYGRQPLPAADSVEVLHALALARLSPDYVPRESRTLSLGEQQRVSLARALITRPQVLLLDEPTSALDRPTADHLAATFHDICRKQKLTVVLVTHDPKAAQHARFQIHLEKGVLDRTVEVHDRPILPPLVLEEP